MKTATLKALRGSIKKWELIATGKGIDEGPDNCPLCNLFNQSDHDKENCRECPVFLKTGKIYCKGTPYKDYVKAISFRTANDFLAGGAATRMLFFLQSLLPKR